MIPFGCFIQLDIPCYDTDMYATGFPRLGEGKMTKTIYDFHSV